MSVTLRQLRRSIGRTVGDLLLVTATAAGSTTSLTDTQRLGVADKALIGRLGIVSEGTAGNLGRIVRVTNNVFATATMTFTPALPASVASGDVIELYNDRDTAVGPEEITAHINDVITEVAASHRTEENSDELSWTFDNTAGLAIPEDWYGFVRAEYEDFLGKWRSIPLSDVTVNIPGRVVFLHNRSAWLADGMTVRLVGYVIPGTLSADSDTTTINPEFLKHQVSANILMATASKRMNSVEARQDAITHQARANAIRPKTVRRSSASWIKL